MQECWQALLAGTYNDVHRELQEKEEPGYEHITTLAGLQVPSVKMMNAIKSLERGTGKLSYPCDSVHSAWAKH